MKFETRIIKPKLKQEANNSLYTTLVKIGHESPNTTSNKDYSPNTEFTFTGIYGTTKVTFESEDFETGSL